MRTTIEIKGVIPGLNGPDGLIRQHWTKAKKVRLKYQCIIMSQTKNSHKGPVEIEYIGYKVTLMDWDNFCSSFKHIGDALVKAKVIKDDNPKIICNFLPNQIKISARKEQKVIIKIKDI